MQIDRQSLGDLDLAGPAGGSGVLDRLDLTRTRGGSRAFRARLQSPFADPTSIRTTQEAVRFLAGADFPLSEPEWARATAHLASTIEVPRGTGILLHAESLWLDLRYRDLARELRAGVGAVLHALQRLDGWAHGLAARTPPPALAGLLTAVLEVTREPALAAGLARTGPLSGADAVRLDQLLRGRLAGCWPAVIRATEELDALVAMAAAGTRFGFTMPELIDGERFVVAGEGVWHPLVDEPVRNPVELRGGRSLVFLTGPNMAGKTTWMRAVGLCVALAQAGMPVPARAFRWTPVDALFTSLSVRDDLRAGLSFFLAEVRRVRQAAELLASGTRSLVLFDEVFKGTNVRDALEASRAVIVGFARASRSGCVFSSHLVELVEDLRAHQAVRFAHFAGEVVDGVARYDFALRDGWSDQRLGLQMLAQEDIPALLARIGAA